MFHRTAPKERAKAVIADLRAAVEEYDSPHGSGRMPYPRWKNLAIGKIAAAIYEAEEAVRRELAMERIRNQAMRLVLMMLATGVATVAFWSGVMIIGRLVKGE